MTIAAAAVHRRDCRSVMYRWCLSVVLLSVVCAQALGFMHGTAHAFHADNRLTGFVAASTTVVVAVPDADSQGRAEYRTAAEDWVKSLFSIHDEANDCRMFDGLGQQCLPLPASGFPPLLVAGASIQRLLACTFVARQAKLFDARGPPSC